MIINECTEEEKAKFIQIFNKKFVNFCSKVPSYISFSIVDDSVYLYKHTYVDDVLMKSKLIEFPLDYSKPVKENISNIKIWLIKNVFPMLKQI
jgi:hypothetical protein